MELNPQDIGVINDELIGASTTNDNDAGNTSNSQSDESSHESEALDPAGATGAPAYHITKWKRLRRQFNDQYLELFNSVCDNNSVAEDSRSLHGSQHGAVKWASEEKVNLFTAIEKVGLHDLASLSIAVATKSPVEIRAYLDAVNNAHIERQIFMANPKNASRAEIPAAVEIGSACETALESAADALSAYQEQYDITAGQEEYGQFCLIDRDAATHLDFENDNSQLQSGDDATETIRYAEEHSKASSRARLHCFFKISNMLDLSEQFFMNQSSNGPFLHWKSISEPNQRPAMMQDTLETMLQLITDRLREVINITLQVANVRLSSMASDGYEPTQSLGRSDVVTALDILNHPQDSWDFWTKLARRNHFQTVTGSHSKGESRMKVISTEDAEATLATRRNRGRRRSMSIGSETSSVPSEYEDAGSLSGLEETLIDEDYLTSSEAEGGSSIEDDVPLKRSRSASSGSVESSDVSVVHDVRPAMSREERKFLLDEALEEYMEKADGLARTKEETQLWQILGKRNNTDVEGDFKLGPRPKRMRKTQDELRDWSCNYMAEWELSVGPDVLMEESTGNGSKEADVENSGKVIVSN